MRVEQIGKLTKAKPTADLGMDDRIVYGVEITFHCVDLTQEAYEELMRNYIKEHPFTLTIQTPQKAIPTLFNMTRPLSQDEH